MELFSLEFMISSPLSRARLAWGLVAGLLAAFVMLLVMAGLRAFLFLPTPTELIFDRAFPLITTQFFIDSLVRAGGYTPLKLQGVAGALAGHFAVAGAGGLIYAWYVGSRNRRGWKLVLAGVLAVWLLGVALLWPQLLTNYQGHPPARATLLSAAAMLISFAACGAALMFFFGLLTAETPDRAEGPGLSRRRFVAAGVGAISAVALGAMLKRLFNMGSFSYDGTEYLGPEVAKITPNDKFYQVTKNLVDPEVARDLWRLELTGHVQSPRTYTYAEVTALPAVEQETTLQCISYRVGGGLISNAVWKGVPLPLLLASVKPKAGAAAVLFHAADGYFETFPFSKAMDPTTIVAWEMNGAPLPPRHGYPVRLVVPGIYGERSPKWVTRLEFIAEGDPRLKMKRHEVEGVGFYTEQGWGPNIVVPTTSRFDAPLVTGDHFEEAFQVGRATELRGMAFGGDRGINRVELSFDDGAHWTDAQISQPGTRVSWSLWTYRWTPTEIGKPRLIVRATNGDGEPQVEEDRNSVPQGALGLHRVRAAVVAA